MSEFQIVQEMMAPENTGFLQQMNKLVGGILLVQKRVKKVPCVSVTYSQFVEFCYDVDNVDTAPILNKTLSVKFTHSKPFIYDPKFQGYSAFFSLSDGYEQNYQRLEVSGVSM